MRYPCSLRALSVWCPCRIIGKHEKIVTRRSNLSYINSSDTLSLERLLRKKKFNLGAHNGYVVMETLTFTDMTRTRITYGERTEMARRTHGDGTENAFMETTA